MTRHIVLPVVVCVSALAAVNARAGIGDPKDLEGKRVGVNRGYTVTAGVWARGVLQDEYGVDLSRITWVLSGDEHVAEYRAPANVVPIEKGQTCAPQLVPEPQERAVLGGRAILSLLRPIEERMHAGGSERIQEGADAGPEPGGQFATGAKQRASPVPRLLDNRGRR